MHRRLGHAHALAPGRDAGMQVGQRLAVIEPLGLGHEAFDQRQHAVGPIDEAARAPRANRRRLARGPHRARLRRGRRRRPAAARAASGNSGSRNARLPPRTARAVRHRPGRRRHRETRSGIAVGGLALRLDEDRPARAEAAQRVVEPRGDRDQLGRRGGVEIGPAKPRRALERAVLVEDDALRRPAPPRAGSRRGCRMRRRYSARFIMARPHATRCCG